ncbi:hypothetical protein GH714_039602 [Hevea brasiliensis]|uniref:Uncharacterized protein n=1 Tax=Hevea brasiliensis TaxID=3981 RepID=A0A6A6KQ06_HEVBR|nr:hypothetical protein GH714_039602 [Hevea brasiliensis]
MRFKLASREQNEVHCGLEAYWRLRGMLGSYTGPNEVHRRGRAHGGQQGSQATRNNAETRLRCMRGWELQSAGSARQAWLKRGSPVEVSGSAWRACEVSGACGKHLGALNWPVGRLESPGRQAKRGSCLEISRNAQNCPESPETLLEPDFLLEQYRNCLERAQLLQKASWDIFMSKEVTKAHELLEFGVDKLLVRDKWYQSKALDDPNHAKCPNRSGVGRVPMETRVLLESGRGECQASMG